MTVSCTMMRMRGGIVLRKSEIIRLAKAVTTVTEMAMTKAGCNFTVTANAEQMPNTCTVMGLLPPKGVVINLRFLAENQASFSCCSI